MHAALRGERPAVLDARGEVLCVDEAVLGRRRPAVHPQALERRRRQRLALRLDEVVRDPRGRAEGVAQTTTREAS
jgi:hypothetical protein